MTENINKAKKNIMNSLFVLEKLFDRRPNALLLQLFLMLSPMK